MPGPISSAARLFDSAPRPKGVLRVDVYRLGVLQETIEEKNLIVNGAATVLANLVGGNVTNNSVTQIRFGTNGTAPVGGNTGLTGAFMKNVDSVIPGTLPDLTTEVVAAATLRAS